MSYINIMESINEIENKKNAPAVRFLGSLWSLKSAARGRVSKPAINVETVRRGQEQKKQTQIQALLLELA